MSEDLYRILEVSKGAPASEIKKNYRRLARKYHPDRNPGEAASEKFKKISAAFAVLGDEKKRALYDEFGPDGLREGFDANSARQFRNFGGGFGGGFGNLGGLGGFGDLEELLGGLFGGGGRPQRARPSKGKDRSYIHEVDFDVLKQGGLISLPGGGRVKVPSGAYDGQKLRLSGRGEPGAGGPGDLIIELRMRLGDGWERAGGDLLKTLPLRVSDAVLGAEVEVDLLDGKQTKVRIAAGAQNGQRLRLREQGLPLKGGRGHLFLVLKVVLPTGEDEALAECVRQLDAFYPDTTFSAQ